MANHQIFMSIRRPSPLPITEDLSATSGTQSVAYATHCMAALTRATQLICTSDCWLQKVLGNATPSVPLRMERLVHLGCHRRKMYTVGDPDSYAQLLPTMPGMITVLVESAKVTSWPTRPR